jgi:hypothetical protein
MALLAIVAQAPRLHLLLSVDHCNAALQWDTATARALRLLWCEAHTFDPCVREDAVLGAVVAARRGARGSASAASTAAARAVASNARGARKGVAFVLKTLTHAHHALLRFIAERAQDGVTFRALCAFAKEKWLADRGQDASVRAIVGEFKDHTLVVEKRKGSGARAVTTLVAVDGAALMVALDAM